MQPADSSGHAVTRPHLAGENDVHRRSRHFGMVRTLLRPRRWRRLVRASHVVGEQKTFLWREVNRRTVTSRYHLRDSQLVVHVRHDTPDQGGLFEIFVLGNYELPEPIRAALARRARARPLRVADLGGNIGLFGLRVLREFPTAELISFEPDPGNARLLAMTIEENEKTDHWRLVAACAGARRSEVRFLTGRYLESRISAGAHGQGQLLPKVDVFPHLRKVDWAKIDIEGGERELLTDPRFAALDVPVLSLEYHPLLCPSNSPRALATEALTRAGYRIEPFVERAPGLAELWAWRPDAV